VTFFTMGDMTLWDANQFNLYEPVMACIYFWITWSYFVVQMRPEWISTSLGGSWELAFCGFLLAPCSFNPEWLGSKFVRVGVKVCQGRCHHIGSSYITCLERRRAARSWLLGKVLASG